jgi:hypothetical protein
LKANELLGLAVGVRLAKLRDSEDPFAAPRQLDSDTLWPRTDFLRTTGKCRQPVYNTFPAESPVTILYSRLWPLLDVGRHEALRNFTVLPTLWITIASRLPRGYSSSYRTVVAAGCFGAVSQQDSG